MFEPIGISAREHSSAIGILTDAFADDPMVKYVVNEKRRELVRKIYGVMLTTYGCAGVVGPLVFSMPVIKPIALYIAAGLTTQNTIQAD